MTNDPTQYHTVPLKGRRYKLFWYDKGGSRKINVTVAGVGCIRYSATEMRFLFINIIVPVDKDYYVFIKLYRVNYRVSIITSEQRSEVLLLTVINATSDEMTQLCIRNVLVYYTVL